MSEIRHYIFTNTQNLIERCVVSQDLQFGKVKSNRKKLLATL